MLYLLFRTCVLCCFIRRRIVQQCRVRHTMCVRTTLLDHKKCTPSSAQLSSAIAEQRAAQHHAVPCGAALCHWMRCWAPLSCAFFRTHNSTRYHAKYQEPGTGMYVCARIFVSSSIVLPLGPVHDFFRKLYPFFRSKRDIANKHTAQHRAPSSPQLALGVIQSLVAPNHGPLTSAPFACSRILPRASLAPPAERSPCTRYPASQ